MTRMKRFLSFFLAILMLMPLTAVAKPASAEGEFVINRILSAADLLGLLSGSSVGEAEKDYLDRFYAGEIRYNAAIPGGLITVSGGTATAVGGYITKTSDGRSIVWNPDGAVTMRDGVAEVTYRGALSIAKTDANRLLNYVYDEAVNAKAAEDEIAAYDRQLLAHKEYTEKKKQYDADLKAYTNYENWKKNVYDRWQESYLENKAAWDAYDAYVAAKKQFEEDTKAYEADHAAWLLEKARYEQDVKTYEQYLKNKGTVDIALRPMESMFIDYGFWDGSKYGLDDEIRVRSLYDALQNEDLVRMLLQYQDKLCAATSLTRAEFQKLKTTSDELNAILRQYAEKRERSPKEAFLFYQANYVSIRDKFNHLYESMAEILKPSVYTLMCAAMDEEFGSLAPYKKWRIKNVLCQIYMVSQCLDDTSTRTVKWKFFADNGDEHEYLYGDLINQSQILEDLNRSNPTGLSWQDDPGVPSLRAEPQPPKSNATYAEKPTDERESEADAPQYPGTIPSHPGEEPKYVAEPKRVADEKYDTVARCATILEAYKRGEISRRSERSSDATVYVKETVRRRYDPKTGEGAESIYNEKGELSSESLVATHWSGDGRTYVLLGFLEDPDGLCFYPIYAVEDTVFEVTFRSEGKVVLKQKYAYGQMPKPKITPTKAPTNTCVYTFSGWDPVLSLVKGDATYDAVFSESERLYTVTFLYREQVGAEIKDVSLTETHPWGAALTAPRTVEEYIDGLYLYEFIGWNKEIVSVAGDAVYAVQYRKTLLIEDPDDSENHDTEIDQPEPPVETEPPTVETDPPAVDTERAPEESLEIEDGEESMSGGSETSRNTEASTDRDPEPEDGTSTTDTAEVKPEDGTAAVDTEPKPEQTESEAETESESESEPEPEKPYEIDYREFDNKYVIKCNKTKGDFGGLIRLAATKGSTMTFSFVKESVELKASAEATRAFYEKGVSRVELLLDAGTGGRGVGVAFYDKEGARVYPAGYMTLTIPADLEGEGRGCLRRYSADGSHEDMTEVTESKGMLTFEADASSTYGTVRYYTVKVKIGETETVYEREAGEWIPLTVTPPLHFRTDALILTRSGETEGIRLETTDGFTVPSYSCEVTVTFAEILYTVEFRYRGGSYVKAYRYGDTITAPMIPLTVTEGDTVYTFIGWNDSFSLATEDRVIEALYEALTVEEAADKGDEGAMEGVVRYWILPAVGIALGVIAVLTVGIILTVKLLRKRRKKKENHENAS